MSDLLRRQQATDATLKKYRNRPCDFRTADCIRMIRYHLLAMGHKPPPLPQYRSRTGALRALKQAGGLVAILDSLLPRIPHARMLPGDVAVMEGEGGMDAGAICLGYKLAAWHEDSDEMVNLVPLAIKAAWRA